MLRQLLHHLDALTEEVAILDTEIKIVTAPHETIILRQDVIPGVNRRTVEVILAEIGPGVKAFPSAQHLAW